MKKVLLLYIIMSVFLLLISNTIAQDLKLSYSTDDKLGSYKIEKCDGLLCSIGLGTKTITQEHKLISYTNDLIDGFAYGISIIYEDSILFKSVEFKDLYGKNVDIIDYKVYLKVNDFVEVNTKSYDYTCKIGLIVDSEDKDKLSSDCIEKENDVSYMELRTFYKEYKGEKLKPGKYEWKLHARKYPSQKVDFIIVLDNDYKLDKWAWFDLAFEKRRQININNTGSAITNASIIVNISKETGMAHDFADIRFSNFDGDSELFYYIENKTDNVNAYVFVRIPTLSATSVTSIYLYFNNNTPVSSKSNFNNAFLFADDFNQNTTLNYTYTGNQPRYRWNTNGTFTQGCGAADGTYCGIVPNIQGINTAYIIDYNSSQSNYNNGYMGIAGFTTTSTNGYYIRTTPPTPVYEIGKVNVADIASTALTITDDTFYRKTTWFYGNGTFKGIFYYQDLTPKIVTGVNTDLTQSGQYRSHILCGGAKPSCNQTFDWLRVYPILTSEPVITYGTIEEGYTLIVSSHNPTANQVFTTNNIFFNCSVESLLLQAVNLSLYINSALNKTEVNTTSPQNLTLTETYYLPEGSHSYYCSATDTNDNILSSGTKTFYIDQTSPVVNFVYPINNQEFLTKNDTINISFNTTATDNIALSSCAYIQNIFPGNVFRYVTCGQNTTYNLTTYGGQNNNISYFANDTANNQATTSIQVYVNKISDSLSFSNKILSEQSQTIYLYINATNLTSYLTTANLTYNNTIYPMTLSSVSSNSATFYVTINSPTATIISNKTIYANYTIHGNKQSTSLYYQLVNPYVSFTFSNATCKDIIYNFTLYDEQNLSLMYNGTIEYNLYYGSSTNSTKLNSYGIITPATNLYICGNFSVTDSWVLDSAEFKYYKDEYARETYYLLKNTTITNQTINVSLYGLIADKNTPFIITYNYVSFTPRPDSLIFINRKYISLGTYKTIEIVKTDSLGTATANMEAVDSDSNVIYQFVVTDLYGNILSIFNDLSVKCQNELTGECKINLNAQSSSGSININQSVYNMYYELDYNTITKLISATFTNSDGISLIVLNATEYGYGKGSLICSDSLNAITGTLSCDVSGLTNSTISVKLYKNNVLITEQVYLINPTSQAIYGTDGYILAFLLILTLPMMFISSPIAMVIGVVIGIIVSVLLLFLSNGVTMLSGTSIVLWVCISTGIIIWQFTRNRGGDI